MGVKAFWSRGLWFLGPAWKHVGDVPRDLLTMNPGVLHFFEPFSSRGPIFAAGLGGCKGRSAPLEKLPLPLVGGSSLSTGEKAECVLSERTSSMGMWPAASRSSRCAWGTARRIAWLSATDTSPSAVP